MPSTREIVEDAIRRHEVLEDVLEERRRQDERYDNTKVPFGIGPETCWLLPYVTFNAVEIEKDLRRDYDNFESGTGHVTFVHLLREELAELFTENDIQRAYVEAIQVAALAVSFCEEIKKGRTE